MTQEQIASTETLSERTIDFSPPDVREEDIDAVVAVLRSGWITSGPVGARFEDALTEYTGVGGAVLLNSCTAALELSLRVLGVGRGDEVVVSAYTYTATAAVIRHVGATIVLADTEQGQYVPSISGILAVITPRTKAVIVTDLAGVPFDARSLMDALGGLSSSSTGAILGELGRPAVIVDGAHSLGAARGGLRAGALGDFTAFSFHAVKNLTTGEGGALTWRPDLPADCQRLTTQVRRLSLHGQSKDALSKMRAGAWEYDIVELGYKYNMPDILAALGLSQLLRYDDSLARRHELVEVYGSGLEGHVKWLAHRDGQMLSSAHLFMIDLGDHWERRNEIIADMAGRGIATNVHYKPLPLLSAYSSLGFSVRQCPNAIERYQRELTLPLHTALTDDDVEYVMVSLRDCLE